MIINCPKKNKEFCFDLITVVMPAYNAALTIGEAISSVLNQSYSKWELIVVDDCSEDTTREIVHEYIKKDDRIHLINNKINLGVAEARNVGILKASGKYIALLDSDDVWEKDKLTRQVELAMDKKVQLVYCSYDFIDQNGKKIKKPFIVPENTNYQGMLRNCVISSSTAMIDAQLLKNNLFDPMAELEDYALWMHLLSLPISVAGDKKVLMHYRQMPMSRSSNKLFAAVKRWKFYRNYLKMGIAESAISFITYIFISIKKYAP